MSTCQQVTIGKVEDGEEREVVEEEQVFIIKLRVCNVEGVDGGGRRGEDEGAEEEGVVQGGLVGYINRGKEGGSKFE